MPTFVVSLALSTPKQKFAGPPRWLTELDSSELALKSKERTTKVLILMTAVRKPDLGFDRMN